ncbi:MAG: chromosomal replication initiator protein [Chloroflexi bacterium]|nr:MAG: chromosomal replication initiator protein [Chloroflexota bacterium]
MDRSIQNQSLGVNLPGYQQAWEMVLGELRHEMSRALYETWVQPLRPIGYQNHIFTVGAYNTYGRAWVEERLSAQIARCLEGLYNETVTFKVIVQNGFYKGGESTSVLKTQPIKTEPEPQAKEPDALYNERSASAAQAATDDESEPPADPRSRKFMLQRAYGSERARLIQPERGMYLTNYLFANWLPLLGHSAFTVILAARSLCYWNPMTGELRNVVETEMGEIAEKAAVSVRTVKDVLNTELVQRYFLRYRVRRVMTSNGVRTAGISLQVRMDDPLTPLDQVTSGLMEEEEWYLPEFSGEKE